MTTTTTAGTSTRDFYLDDDGYYCTQCGSQSQDLIHTQTADENLLADGTLYNIRHTRTLLSQELDRTLGRRPAAKQENEDFFGVGDDGLSESRGFGSGLVSDREELMDVIRFRYVEGLQVMVQRQCEVLVERFGVSAYDVGIVGPILLRYVAERRVLADD
ncbi:uncharacterized protein A4U43_C10F3780 [Asparagus officinalis]|uniref:Uncharacterized protein n=1 Tax=Asparagus officinalis TaxID=4686 RepID=A0A5P1E3N9_ASPOF|nr:uncharacterized protein A4U43_C10F3780 [Asparagus officinalis]